MIDTPAPAPDAASAAPFASSRPRGGPSLVPLVLLFLALVDLRVEILLLMDRFTFTSLLHAIRYHWLATAVLLLQPSLWRHYARLPR
jgi:hypothetical protein